MKAFSFPFRSLVRAALLLSAGGGIGYFAARTEAGADVRVAAESENAAGKIPPRRAVLTRSLAAQEAVVEEKRRQFHAVVPDVPAMEARLARLTGIIRGMSRRDLSEEELIRIAQSLEGQDWMKETLTSYRWTLKNHERLTSAGMGRAHPEVVAMRSQSDALALELSQAIGQVFNHQRRLLERQEKELEAARGKVAAAVKKPESFQHLLLAVNEAEQELQRLRELQTVRLIGSIR